jgi:hypothetical protein
MQPLHTRRTPIGMVLQLSLTVGNGPIHPPTSNRSSPQRGTPQSQGRYNRRHGCKEHFHAHYAFQRRRIHIHAWRDGAQAWPVRRSPLNVSGAAATSVLGRARKIRESSKTMGIARMGVFGLPEVSLVLLTADNFETDRADGRKASVRVQAMGTGSRTKPKKRTILRIPRRVVSPPHGTPG